ESPADQADPILAHGLPLLAHCLGRGVIQGRDNQIPEVDLLFQAGDGRIGVSLCNQADMRSLAAKLRRLGDLPRTAKPARLVLLRDARLPISAGAQKSRKYLDELAKQGARLLRPTAEALAALEALRSLLSDAKAGDLAHRGETIGPRTVEEWLSA